MRGSSEGVGALPSVKVSVVVPVYNPGAYIEPLIDSLLNQTLPCDEFEAIFVDDGSTDDTPARLDRLAAEHPHVRVIHQPNSGWPGKPRNVGIDTAKGEFIQFVDHDDYLAREALERLYDRATETSADVVLGKVVSVRRRMSTDVFWERRDYTSLAVDPLESTLTPHKLFRTSMLREHNIRFPEGRRRLEDNPFVLECYFAARNVAVLADVPCYYFTKRRDNGNYSFVWADPVEYYTSLRDSLDVVETHTEPGELRERLLRHFYDRKMLGRLREPKALRFAEEDLQQLLEQVQILDAERFPESVLNGLPYVDRLRSRLIRAGALTELIALARRCARIRVWTDLTHVGWSSDGILQIEFRAWLGFKDRTPIRFIPTKGGYRLDPRLTTGIFGRENIGTISEENIKSEALLRLLLINRKSNIVWHAPCAVTTQFLPDKTGRAPDARVVRFICAAAIDVSSVGGGRPLRPGTWTLNARASLCGLTRNGVLGPGTRSRLAMPRRRIGLERKTVTRVLCAAEDGLRLGVTKRSTSRLGRVADFVLLLVPARRRNRYRKVLKRALRKGALRIPRE